MFSAIDILTVKNFEEFKFKEKGSLFIGQAFPAVAKDDAEKILDEAKKKYYDATHHCYCYHLYDGETRYSDDGEPNGTAGIRILNAIDHFTLTNVLVIVIRYYGGTKLGVGQLGKAYYQSAFGVLNNSQKIKKSNYLKIAVKYEFDFTSQIHNVLAKYDAEIINNYYDDNPSIEFLLKPDKYENLFNELNEQTRGKAEINIIDKNIIK
jgi:uncharacterized YigZ family protein